MCFIGPGRVFSGGLSAPIPLGIGASALKIHRSQPLLRGSGTCRWQAPAGNTMIRRFSMEEFKPKRKNTAQPAQNGQSAPHTRKPRTPKPQGENAANAQHKPRPRRPRPRGPGHCRAERRRAEHPGSASAPPAPESEQRCTPERSGCRTAPPGPAPRTPSKEPGSILR